LLLISFSLISPLIAAPTEAKLPACCRRDGKHRCAAMQSQSQQSSGLKIASVACAQYPKLKATPVISGGLVVENPVAWFLFRPVETVSFAEDSLRQSLVADGRQERGPPSFSL
jgi:hypothetical protein